MFFTVQDIVVGTELSRFSCRDLAAKGAGSPSWANVGLISHDLGRYNSDPKTDSVGKTGEHVKRGPTLEE